jgi:adenine deaminase
MTTEEALAKVRLGMYVLVREATAAKNLHDLLPAVTAENERRFGFGSDDRHPAELLEEGHMDYMVRLAIKAGQPPMRVIRMATLHTAEAFGLRDRGAIAPGRRADLVVTETLEDFRAEMVFSGGELVGQRGRPSGTWTLPDVDDEPVRGSIHVNPAELDFRVPAEGTRLRVIGIVPEQLVTEALVVEPRVVDGEVVADVERDLVKLAVIERHHGSGNVGLGFVQGLGLKEGAIAGSVAHDCHNITVAGVDDASMRLAVETIKEIGGGLVAVRGDEVLGTLSLPIAGVMSDRSVEAVHAQMETLLEETRALGSTLDDPFMHLGFLALEVIPELKLTDKGLVDVDAFDFVSLWVDED